jgi:hypothetical protein
MPDTKPKLTSKDIEELEALFPAADEEQKVKLQKLLKVYKTKVVEKSGKETFLDFIQHVYPGYKVGAHHARLAKIFEAIAKGEKKRVIVNIAPRHGKSELISYLAPAWFWESILIKKLLWRLIPLILLLTSVGGFVTWWVVMLIKTYFLR